MVHMYQRLERTCTRYLLASRPARAVDRQFFVLSYSRGACLRARGVYSRFSRLARRRRVKEWPRGGGKERAGGTAYRYSKIKHQTNASDTHLPRITLVSPVTSTSLYYERSSSDWLWRSSAFHRLPVKKKKENRARNDAHKQTNHPHATLHSLVPFPDERYSVGSSKVTKDGYTFVTLSRKSIRFRPCQFLSSCIGPLIHCRSNLIWGPAFVYNVLQI